MIIQTDCSVFSLWVCIDFGRFEPYFELLQPSKKQHGNDSFAQVGRSWQRRAGRSD